MREKLESKALWVFVAEIVADHGLRCVGCVEVSQVESSPMVCSIGMLSVDPWRQGDGIGGTLFDEAERFAWDDLKAEKILLWVLRKRDSLIAWYVKRGFNSTGELQDFPPPSSSVGRPREEALKLYQSDGGGFQFVIYQKLRTK